MVATLLTVLSAFTSNRMAEERTFIAVKPDGVQRGLVGEIMKRFERRGYKLVAAKLCMVRAKNSFFAGRRFSVHCSFYSPRVEAVGILQTFSLSVTPNYP